METKNCANLLHWENLVTFKMALFCMKFLKKIYCFYVSIMEVHILNMKFLSSLRDIAYTSACALCGLGSGQGHHTLHRKQTSQVVV